MPRLAQTGGALRRMRVRYTARRKLALLTMAKRLRDEEGISLCKSAERVQVSAGLLVKWEERFSLSNNPIEALLKTKKKSIHPGPLSQLKPLEEVLLKYIFKKREQGIKISTLAIVVVVSNLSDIIPLLILDSYRCHMMASVVSKIQELGVEVKHIPGGCTSLCQPVDVGFNKPFKSRI